MYIDNLDGLSGRSKLGKKLTARQRKDVSEDRYITDSASGRALVARAAAERAAAARGVVERARLAAEATKRATAAEATKRATAAQPAKKIVKPLTMGQREAVARPIAIPAAQPAIEQSAPVYQGQPFEREQEQSSQPEKKSIWPAILAGASALLLLS